MNSLGRASIIALAPWMLQGCGGKTEDRALDVPEETNGNAQCVPTLGAAPVKHACQHGRRGPFVEIAALAEASAAPDMSQVHHTYQVAMTGDGPPYHGFVGFRTSRQGAQAFLHPSGVQLEFLKSSEQLVTSEAAAQSCELFSAAAVMTTDSAARYVVSITSELREFDVFVENLNTFADQAWSERCD